MKKVYNIPQITATRFEKENIVTESGTEIDMEKTTIEKIRQSYTVRVVKANEIIEFVF